MKVEIPAPRIEGDRVRLAWTQSEANPFQLANEFCFRFEGIDLSRYSNAVFDEMFLALQLKVFGAFDEPVELMFSEPVSEWSFDYWRAYHGANNVTASPLLAGPRSPLRETGTLESRPGTVAIFYGGGKDSLAAACLFSELYGSENVVLIQCVGPIRPRRELALRLELRQEGLMLKPARERMGVSSQRSWTDYQAIFLRSADAQRPEIELYTAGALPALLEWRAPLANFSYEWPDFPVVRQPDGSVKFLMENSRPEVLKTLQTHYRRVFDLDLTVTNINSLLSPWTGYLLVAKRYPRAIEFMTSCTLGEIDQRWCYDCRKCVMHALYSLCSGTIDPHFDYNRLFDQARYLRRIVEYAESGVELSAEGNVPYSELLGIPTGFQNLCHVVAGAKTHLIDDQLGDNALANLTTLRAMFGNRALPHLDEMPRCVVPRLGFSDAEQIASMIGDHIETVEEISAPLSVGNEPAEFGLNQIMPTKMSELSHIRA